jgi:hypothetical protein
MRSLQPRDELNGRPIRFEIDRHSRLIGRRSLGLDEQIRRRFYKRIKCGPTNKWGICPQVIFNTESRSTRDGNNSIKRNEPPIDDEAHTEGPGECGNLQ